MTMDAQSLSTRCRDGLSTKVVGPASGGIADSPRMDGSGGGHGFVLYFPPLLRFCAVVVRAGIAQLALPNYVLKSVDDLLWREQLAATIAADPPVISIDEGAQLSIA